MAFTIPAITGHIVIGGDGLIQSYPLRVLVGSQARSGHLPLWDPYIWSGTPLLAGFNAGAAFPVTWLFIVMPAHAAWVLTETIAYAVPALGLYAFLRLHRLSRAACVLGGVTFAFAGFVLSQVVHIDLVQGDGLIPWVLVALHQITTIPGYRGAWRWPALLGVSLGLSILAGSPEATIDTFVVGGIYGLYMLWQNRERAAEIVIRCAAGLAGALLLGAAQWLPGLAFLSESQRSGASGALFASGSLRPPLLIVGLVPYLLGGTGRLGVPGFFGPYNLPEVGVYVGMLPLMAALSLPTKRFRAGSGSRDWWIWYVVIAVFLLLTVGTNTPVGSILAHVPIYSSERLQSRNLVGVDLGLAILFAFWVDRVTHREAGVAPVSNFSRMVPVLPALGVAAIYVLFLAWGGPLIEAFGAPASAVALIGSMTPYMTIALVIALLAAGIACFFDRIPRGFRMRAIAAFTVVDLGVFALYQSWLAFVPTSWLDADTPTAHALAGYVGSSRFAVYNPELYDYNSLLRLGQPDLNVIGRTASSQGYGSIVSASYQEATGAHDQSSLYPAAIRGAALGQLDTSVLLSRVEYFATQLDSRLPAAVLPPPSFTSGIRPPPLPPPLPPLSPHEQRTWYLGTLAEVSTVAIQLRTPGPLSVTVRDSRGRVSSPPVAATEQAAGRWDVRFQKPTLASAVVLENLGNTPMAVASITVGTPDYGRLLLDGPLQDDVKPPHWMFAGMIGHYAVFRNTENRGPFWLQDSGGGAVDSASATLVSTSATGAQTYRVRSDHPVTLVRSVAYERSWTATVSGRDQEAVTRPVERRGAVQGVEVGAGDHVVSFSYRPRDATVGMTVSLATVVAAALLLAVLALRRAATRRAR